MKNIVPQLEPNPAATVDPPEEILSAKEVAQHIEAAGAGSTPTRMN